MKRILNISAVCLCLSAAVLSAQTPLGRIAGKLAEASALIEYDYELKTDKFRTLGEGVVEVQDSLYRMTADGLEISCDGTDLYIVDKQGREVVVEPIPDDGENYQSNPVLLLFNIDKVFNVEGSRSEGKNITYVLSPKVECGISGGVLTVDGSSATPVFVSGIFNLADGSSLDIKIKSMTFSAKKPLTYFRVDISALDSSWVITELN